MNSYNQFIMKKGKINATIPSGRMITFYKTVMHMEEKEVLTEFTRSRMMGYAELLQEIADNYLPEKGEPGGEPVPATRADLLSRRELGKNRAAFSGFVRDTSRQLEQLARTEFSHTAFAKKQEKRIRKELKDAGISLKEYYRTENRNGYTEIGMIVRARGRASYDVVDIAELLTEVTHVQVLPDISGYHYIHNEWIPLCFQEEVHFSVYGGFAKATKEGEEVSGDNYLMREFGDGTYIAAIADGMGSGREASEDSEKVLSLLEKHVESGIAMKDAIRVCGELLYMRHRGERSVSLDLVELNQYSGECHFYKNGATSSFLKRGEKIREFTADRLSMGICPEIEGSRETVFLQNEDIIILLSDGVMDLFYEDMEGFQKYLSGLSGMGLRDMASGILQRAIRAGGGEIHDDMTVLTIGLCEKEADSVAF